ncbi:MAG: polysaccharide deacetylase family protein [Clostridiales bacterium]|jgi:peptidoglycan/xylan/chitin deacetylase (PgdA/CDA1 family)|nr:polysaccharide deacetylase family protein [Clostridiales bacterium]
MRFILVRKRIVLGVVVGALILTALGVGVTLTGAAEVYLNRPTRKLPIYSVETDDKVVALSFDAAWGAERTEGIVAVLKKYEVPATFFLVGFWVDENPEKVKMLDGAGIEIGTHSNTHPHMNGLTDMQMKLELETSSARIAAITGKPVALFRAPFGEYSDRLLTAAEGLNLKTIQWDVDTLDWQKLAASDIAARVLTKAAAGSIVLMHNDGLHTLEALPLIIEGLKNKGFGFKTVGDLVYKDNYTVDHTGRQRPAAPKQ